MNNGISIKFYTPDAANEIRAATLFINNKSAHYLEVDEVLFEYFDMPIKVVYAITEFDEKYSLVNCVFQKTNFSKTLFRIHELYSGTFIDTATENMFVEVEARVTSLTNWIDYSVNEFSFSSDNSGKVSIKKPFQFLFSLDSNCTIELIKHSETNTDNDEINLKSKSYLKFKSVTPLSRIIFYQNVEAFSKFLFLFIEGVPRISGISFTNIKNETITQILSTPNENGGNMRDSFVPFSILEDFLQVALTRFYSRKDSFIKVISFIISSYTTQNPENAFLSITTAFEIYHENFKHKTKDLQAELYFELIGKVPTTQKEKEWTQIIRTYDLIKSVIHQKYFSENIVDSKKITHLIKDSRNYYTHYNVLKNEIWNPNELLKNNKLLREVLKALILKELNFSEKIIEKILRAKPSVFYQNFNHNEYSIFFKKDID